MVLDNIDSLESVGFTDSPPDPDGDPYTSSESETRMQYRIDTDRLPRPMKMLGGLPGFDSLLEMRLKLRIQNATNLLGRPPTQEEVNALAFWTAKQLSLMSYGPATGYSWGLWRAYATRGTFGFPFYTPKFKHNGLAWPSSSFKLFSGPMALGAWHCTRAAAYCLLGRFVSSIFFTSYSVSVMAVGERTDQRLKEYVQARDREVRAVRDHTPSTQSRSVEPTMPSTRHDQTSQAEQAESSLDTGKQPWVFDTGSDDAPLSPDGEKGKEDVSSMGGSVWERLRQQGASQTTASTDCGSTWSSVRASSGTSPSQRTWAASRSPSQQGHDGPHNQGSVGGKDSFAYSVGEEGRQLAREEAQRDFDARVEQERMGGSFTSGTGYRKRQ